MAYDWCNQPQIILLEPKSDRLSLYVFLCHWSYVRISFNLRHGDKGHQDLPSVGFHQPNTKCRGKVLCLKPCPTPSEWHLVPLYAAQGWDCVGEDRPLANQLMLQWVKPESHSHKDLKSQVKTWACPTGAQISAWYQGKPRSPSTSTGLLITGLPTVGEIGVGDSPLATKPGTKLSHT